MRQLSPQLIEDTKFSQTHYRFIAYTVRKEILDTFAHPAAQHLALMKAAEYWAEELRGTGRFDKDKFIQAVIDGEV